MDLVLLKNLAKFSWRDVPVCGFYLIWLAAKTVLSNTCLTDQTSCVNTSVSVYEGESINISFSTKEPVHDLCLWNNSTSKWNLACFFIQNICKPLQFGFKENISLEGETMVLQNVSKHANGIYRLLSQSEKCVASINVFVFDQKDTHLFTILPPKSQSSTIRLEEESEMIWAYYYVLAVPILVISDFL